MGLIPAAGKGSRLNPYPCPKELLPVSGKIYEVNNKKKLRPKLVSEFTIENMENANIKKIHIVVNPNKHQIIEYYGNGQEFGVDISYHAQTQPKSMTSAIIKPLPFLENNIVILGLPDTIIKPYNFFEKLVKYHLKVNSDITLGTFKAKNPSKLGMVNTKNNGEVVNIEEKPKETNLKYAWGAVVWNPKFSKFLTNYKDHDEIFSYIINDAIQQGFKCMSYSGEDYTDIGTFDEYADFITRELSNLSY